MFGKTVGATESDSIYVNLTEPFRGDGLAIYVGFKQHRFTVVTGLRVGFLSAKCSNRPPVCIQM